MLSRGFWLKPSQWREWLLLTAVIGFALLFVTVNVKINAWNKTFYDALADFNGGAMPALIVQFLFYIVLITVFVACGNWIRKTLIFRWREHLTKQLQQAWLHNHSQYRLRFTDEPDNPDQRIAEDVALLADKSIFLFKYFIMNLAKLGAFIVVLWQISGVQQFNVGGYDFTVHGYLVWIALIYTAICTLITHLIGRKLQPLNVERQHREADYRTTLIRVRDNGEQIAFYHGENTENHRLLSRFVHIKNNWKHLINREFKLETFSLFYLRIVRFIPIIACLPMYLNKTMTFGDVMQAQSAFFNVQDGFGWFMDYYRRIMEWSAVVERLAQFQEALDSIDTHNQQSNGTNKENLLNINRLTLRTDTGKPLLNDVNCTANAGEWLLLDGASGIGKTTLLRTLAGMWQFYDGSFRVASKALFLPQYPYLPQDSLRACLSYPNAQPFTDQQISEALAGVGLAELATQIDREREWHKVLSGGEQQRFSLARALLHRPTVLFLDESVSQLDEATAKQLLLIVREHLPNTLCVGISHQNSVKMMFDRRLNLNNSVGGASNP